MRSDVKQLIADSSGLVSLVNELDRNHHAAEQVATQLVANNGLILVPEDVFSETLNIISKKIGRDKALTTGDVILSSDSFVVVASKDEMRLDAFARFRKQPASVSFTDCMVMACATYYGTKEVFGFDECFAKNGYVVPDQQAA